MWVPMEVRRGRQIPKSWSYIIGSCELPDEGGYWERNLGPLEEEQVLLTAEPFPNPSLCFI